MRLNFLFFILTLLLISCADNERQQPKIYAELKTAFFDLRHSDWTKNDWIRKPENLKSVHETFKSFGYEKLEKFISIGESQFLIQGIYIKRNIYQLFDSLEISYNNPEIQNKYYLEFWQRRIEEKNDSVVFEIIKELNQIKSKKDDITIKNQFVNDTLLSLLKIEFRTDEHNEERFYQDFEALKKYGFHQSAYNLLYERYEYGDLKLNREKLANELTRSTEYIYPWIMDNTK